MENFDINSFDFDSMAKALGSNPFEQGKKSYKDERFYTLPKAKDGSGQAVIALLPDAHKHSIIKLFKINTTIQHGGKRAFCSEWSPKSIGLPCPFNETYINHYDEDPDSARKFKPQEKWVCNIKVIKDPAEPKNEGKIFLYEMSKTMAQMIENTLKLSETDIQMGMQRKEIFNPLKGWILNLKCFKKPENGITDYSSSSFTQLPNGATIYNLKGGPITDEVKNQCIEEIKTKCYDLGDFMKPENFSSYEDLTKQLERVCQGLFGIGAKGANTQSQSTTAQVNIETEVKDANAVSGVSSTPNVASAPSTPNASSVDDDLSALINQL